MGWWEEIAISTHLRNAAGVCLLSTGLLIASAGGAIASADSGSTDTPATPAGTNDANPTTGSSRGTVETFADSVRKAVENSLQSTVQGVTGTLNTLAKSGPYGSIPKSPKTTFGGTPTVHGSTDSATVPEGATPPPPAPLVETAVSPVSTPVTPSTPVVPPVVPADPYAATSQPWSQVTSQGLAPVTNAVKSITDSIVAVPGVVVGLPTSVTPVSDVLLSIQNVLTSVGEAGTSLSQLPTDLAGLLGVNATVSTPTIGAATGAPRFTSVAAPTSTSPVWSALPQLPDLLAVDGAPAVAPSVAPTFALPTPLDVATAGTSGVASVTSSTPVASKAASRSDVLSTVEHVIGAVVATVSLTALAAMALPGLLGLLSTCAAGIRIGYRQAKATSALPDTAISRFVGSGPVGVVRSGSQVQLRSRALRAGRPEASKVGPRPTLTVVGSDSPVTQLLDHAV